MIGRSNSFLDSLTFTEVSSWLASSSAVPVFSLFTSAPRRRTASARRTAAGTRSWGRTRGRAAARTQLLVNHVLTDMVIMSKSQIFRKYNSSASQILSERERFMAGPQYLHLHINNDLTTFLPSSCVYASSTRLRSSASEVTMSITEERQWWDLVAGQVGLVTLHPSTARLLHSLLSQPKTNRRY